MGGGAATLGEQQVVGEKPPTKILINQNFPTSQKNQSKTAASACQSKVFSSGFILIR